MRIFALQLNNDIKGIEARKEYIESLIASLPSPDLVVLPELAIRSYMASQKIWEYADDCGRDTSAWAIQRAKKYNTYVGGGYLDKEKGDYFEEDGAIISRETIENSIDGGEAYRIMQDGKEYLNFIHIRAAIRIG